ncbi:hypothetical protein D0Z07_1950, partial [Hyphodiscus hymeniophilus]
VYSIPFGVSLEVSFPNTIAGGSALAVIWILIGITIVVVCARLWTQARVTYQLGLSDALMAMSIATLISMASLITVQYHYGWGRHFAYLSPRNGREALRYNAIGQAFGIMGSTWGRLSFIVLMIKLFGTNQARRTALWCLFAVQIVFNGIIVICLYAQCTDIRSLWDFDIPDTCWNADIQTYLGYAHTAFNGATDLFLTFLPATILWTLQMKTKLKMGLCVLLGLSLFAFVAVIMKLVKLRALSERGDYTYNTVQMFVWVITEGCLVDIAASVPLIRPLFTSSGINSTTNTFEMTARSYGQQKGISSSRAFTGRIVNNAVKLSDGGSEEDILPMHGTYPDDGAIMKQTSYAVEYDVEKQRQRGHVTVSSSGDRLE